MHIFQNRTKPTLKHTIEHMSVSQSASTMYQNRTNKGKGNSHKSTNERLPFAITAGDDPHPIRRPLQIIDPTRQNLELFLQNVVVVGPPDPNRAGHVSRGDPLPVRREPCHRGRIRMLTVNGDVEWIVQVENNDGSPICVKNLVGFWVARDQDSTAPLC